MTHRTRSIVDRICGSSTAIAALACLWFATPTVAADAEWAYDLKILVSDGSRPANFIDPNLKNPWGVAFNPFGFNWVANNHTGTSTLYDGTGSANPLVVAIPGVNGEEAGEPTGIVYSGGTDFVVTDGVKKGPARFIFAGEDGTISGWAPDVNVNEALIAVDRSAQDAVYMGLAIGGNGTGHRLYATNFHSGRVEVFDGSFKRIVLENAFVDPKLPAGYAPFGIQNVGGDIVVTFAKRLPGEDDEATGKGLGIVDLFDANGRLVSRIASFGELNAPWGVALAPRSFGQFGGALLIGNFGDGTINAYEMTTGEFLGKLRRSDGKAVRLEGLWGMAFGNGLLSQPTNTLYVAAGVNDETGGAYAAIKRHR